MDFISPLQDRGRLIFVTLMNAVFWLFFVPLAFVYGELVNVFRRGIFLQDIFKNTAFAAALAVYWFSPALILSFVTSRYVGIANLVQAPLFALGLLIVAGLLGLVATLVYPIALVTYARYGKYAFHPKIVFSVLKSRFTIYLKEWAIWILLSFAAFFILYLVPFFGILGFIPYLLFCFVEAYILLAFAYEISKLFEYRPQY